MKNNFLFHLLVLFTAGILAMGCGGEDASIAPNTANDVKSPVSPVEQLKSISDDLSKEVDSVMQPITDVDDVATTIEQLPKKYPITSSDLKSLASGVLSGGEIALPANIPPEAKDDVTALLTKVKGIGTGLAATPAKVSALVTKLPSQVMSVSTLAGKELASLTAKAANPFASADAKAKIQADLATLNQVKTDTMKKFNDAKAKIMGLPALATQAMAKITAALASNEEDARREGQEALATSTTVPSSPSARSCNPPFLVDESGIKIFKPECLKVLKAGSKKAEPVAVTSAPISVSQATSAFLNINSIPASMVLLDGKPIGSTPKVKFPVLSGVHSVLFINVDQNFRQQISATVTAGETRDVLGRAVPREPWLSSRDEPIPDDVTCIHDQGSPTEILVCTDAKCETSISASYAMLCVSSPVTGTPGATSVTCHKWQRPTSSSSTHGQK